MLDSANYRSESHVLTNCNFTQLKTHHFINKLFFFFLALDGVNQPNRTMSDPPLLQKQNNRILIAQKLYIGLGERKAEERKTDSDKHYIATSAKCICSGENENS